MHTLNVEKSRWTAREISLTAAMTAVVFLLTFVPKIPSLWAMPIWEMRPSL